MGYRKTGRTSRSSIGTDRSSTTSPTAQKGIGRPQHYEEADVVASYHRRYDGGWAQWKHRRKLKVLRSWFDAAEPARILEVACGPGRFFEAYHGYRSVSLDRSRVMLERFRKEEARAVLIQGDAAGLPFASDSFDIVFATRFLSHLRGAYRAQVLNELARVTRDRVILDGRHLYNFRYVSRWVRRRLRLAHADKLRHTYGEFRRELAAAGLEVERVRSIAWGLSARFLICATKASQTQERKQAEEGER